MQDVKKLISLCLLVSESNNPINQAWDILMNFGKTEEDILFGFTVHDIVKIIEEINNESA